MQVIIDQKKWVNSVLSAFPEQAHTVCAEAVLEFLEDTRVGCWTAAGTARRQAEVDQSGEGEEGSPEPP